MAINEASNRVNDGASRREFVRNFCATMSLPLFSASHLIACQRHKTTATPQKADKTIDEALGLLFSTGHDHRGSTHVPMVAETLVRLQRTEQVLPWVEQHYLNPGDGKKAEDFIRTGEISPKNFRDAWGKESRRADWVDFFERQIAEAGWKVTLSEWTTRLVPGMAAFAAHGMIRTAHAVRSLEAFETPVRKRELAEGLGLWAATYQALPEAAAKARGTLKPSEAIRRVETLPAEQLRRGNIVTGLTSLDDFPAFATVINLVDTSMDAAAFLADLTETFAEVYLANAQDFRRMITLVHAVTGTSAARLLLPYVKPEVKNAMLRYGWQLAAGLYAIAGRAPRTNHSEAKLPDKDDLIERAIKNGSPHPIKFTEACLREYALNSKPIYLFAAAHAVENLRG